MLALADLCQYIRSQTDVGEGISAGILDDRLQHCIGVFDNNRSPDFRIPIGGKENARYYKLSVFVLIHWGTTQREAAKKAQEVFELFYGVTNMKIKDSSVAFFAASAPQWLGFTEEKICEYVMPIEIYVNKEE